MILKKKQHYVWRQYLRNWSFVDDRIFFIYKSSGEVKATNLDRVAQKRFFYEVDSFTEEQESVLTKLIEQWSNDLSKETNLRLVNIFLTYSKVKRVSDILRIAGKGTRLDIVKKNTLEDLHAVFEKFGDKLISINVLSDISFFLEPTERLKALIYICVQYTRTNQMHSKAVNGLSLFEYFPESALKLIAITFSVTLGSNLALLHKLRITYIKNISNSDFITTDQPIINTKTNFNELLETTELLEFYYPVKPNIAILISTSNADELVELEISLDSEINSYNSLLIKANPDFIFARKKETLFELKNNFSSKQ